MGCTSSKPKRTKSLEDVKGQAQNGQITKEDTSTKKPVSDKNSTTTNPIQIPGANKSFQAPDGIPFIDEDVDEDDAKLRTGVRENSKKPTDEVNLTTESSAFVVNGSSGGGGVRVSTSRNAGGDVGEVLVNEKGVHVVARDGSIVPIKKGPAPSPITDEQPPKHSFTSQERAAVKIQAGIRGYLDRKRVHNLKNSRLESEAACLVAPPQVMPEQVVVDDHYHHHQQQQQPHEQPQPHEQHYELKYDENTAATKIQANFKGYKTRKQMKTANNSNIQ